ncbi:hypothetical protein [Pseudonocardia nigra]|uniref:hypothetical protein n=1 Tax=Pseudonocardia nigra TaxID=1921578 RepID=UPI001C5EFCAF|nr:hypothetical protein [Pseudonocardia nigra]
MPTTVWTTPADAPDRTPVERVLAAFPVLAADALLLTADDLRHARPSAVTGDAATRRRATGRVHEIPARVDGTAVRVPPTRLGTATPTAGDQAASRWRAVGSGPAEGEPGAAVPFWADMIDGRVGAATSRPPARPEPAPVGTRLAPLAPQFPPINIAARHEGPAVGCGRARGCRLLVVDLGCQEAGDQLGLLAAELLAPGGLLTVLTHSEHRSGVLVDPTGSVVASAQNADLLYLQHIVMVERPLHIEPTPAMRRPVPSASADGARADRAAASEDGRRPRTDSTSSEPEHQVAGRGVIDLLLFAQPADLAPLDEPDPRTAPELTGDPA